MKTLLFAPPKFDNMFVTVNECCFGMGTMPVVPNRLLNAGSYLRQQGDHVDFFDASVMGLSWAGAWKYLKNQVAIDRIIFETTPQFERFQMFAADMAIKLGIDEVVVMAPTAYQERLLAERSDGEIIPALDMKFPTLDLMPPMDLTLLTTDRYVPHYQVTEGCIYKCSFCVWGVKDFHRRSPETVVENFKGVTATVPIYLLCCQLTTSKLWLEEFAEKKKELDMDFEYVTDINAKEVTEEKIELLKGSGCTQAIMGAENLHPHVQEKIGKGLTEEEVAYTVHMCEQHELPLQISFLYNIDPCEDAALFDIPLYKKHPSFKPSVGIVKVYPGTELGLELTGERDYVLEEGLHPLPTNKGLKKAQKELAKWRDVLGA